METISLLNGNTMPMVGFGTFQTPDGEIARQSVKCALERGYRHIDAAYIYRNQSSVGQGIAESGLKREEIFVTSKVWNTERGYDKTIAACECTLQELGLDYLDLYLIHWPANEMQFADWAAINADTWRALEDLYDRGLVRAIGVSNFLVYHLESLLPTARIQPMVNQIEYHPGYCQPEVTLYCKAHNIVVQAWSPLGQAKLMEDELLVALAVKYDKTVAQICLRWIYQSGVVSLPKSVTESRIVANIDIFDFHIDDQDMQLINAMPEKAFSGLHPDRVSF